MILKILIVFLALIGLGVVSIFTILAIAQRQGKKMMKDMATKMKMEAEAMQEQYAEQNAPETPEGEVRVKHNPNVSSTQVDAKKNDDDYIDFEEVS